MRKGIKEKLYKTKKNTKEFFEEDNRLVLGKKNVSIPPVKTQDHNVVIPKIAFKYFLATKVTKLYNPIFFLICPDLHMLNIKYFVSISFKQKENIIFCNN